MRVCKLYDYSLEPKEVGPTSLLHDGSVTFSAKLAVWVLIKPFIDWGTACNVVPVQEA